VEIFKQVKAIENYVGCCKESFALVVAGEALSKI